MLALQERLAHVFGAGGDVFFSSRRRHTRCSRDWSSDVCSSDLSRAPTARSTRGRTRTSPRGSDCWESSSRHTTGPPSRERSTASSIRRRSRPTHPRCERRRSEEHTSELQSRLHLVCRLLLEKKKTI